MDMNNTIEGEVLDSMPTVAREPASTALAQQENPFQHMAMVAMEKGAVDQLDKLLDLQLKWDAEQARRAFVASMAEFKAEAGGITIAKSKNVKFKTSSGVTEYDHAELHDITRALVPVLAKHGLSHSWNVTQANAAITVECIMSHRAGHSERVSMTAPADASGGKNNIQAIASTKTYLERYTLLAATGMATGGELDDDGRSYAPEATPEPADEKAKDWIQQADRLERAEEYAPLKAKMMADYGGVVKNIPVPVRLAFSAANARVMPKDEE